VISDRDYLPDRAAMKISQATSDIDVKIVPALPAQEPILANLLELYRDDFLATRTDKI
jgi:hypothetical protein